MIRIAIVDDDEFYLNRLKSYFEEFCINNSLYYEIETFLNSKQAMCKINKITFDIIVLDIDMPEISGIEIAKSIRKFNSKVTLIFVTNMEHLVFESVKYAPYRFIRKIKMEQEILELMNALQGKFVNEDVVCEILHDGEIKRIKLIEIIYFESFKHDVFLHDVYNNEYQINEPLKDLLAKYESAGFIKIHKSYIVNYRYIFEITHNSIILDDKKELPASKNRMSEIKRQYTGFTRKEIQ